MTVMIKILCDRVDALEKYMEASLAIQGDEYNSGLSKRDMYMLIRGFNRRCDGTPLDELIATHGEHIIDNAPPPDMAMYKNACAVVHKRNAEIKLTLSANEIQRKEIEQLEAEVALRGERLFVLWKHYEEYLNITEPNWVAFNAWFKDGKYIGGEL